MFSFKPLLTLTFSLLLFSQIVQAQSLIEKMLPDLSVKQSEASTKVVSEKASIIDIQVIGNNKVSDEDVIAASQLSLGDDYDPLRLHVAKRKVKSLGVFRKVDASVKEDPNGVRIVFECQEYPIVTEVIVTGNSVYTKEFLEDSFATKAGAASNIRNVRDDIQFIEQLYEEDGYIEAKVYEVETPRNGDGPVVFYVAEGIIEDISITGNVKTRDYVILREMSLRPGDVLSKQALQADARRVFNLNFFENLEPEIIPSETPHHYHLRLKLTEREHSGGFTFGGGFSPTNGFNIFSDLYWSNVFGQGKEIMLKGNFGLGTSDYDNESSTYQIKYHDPWAFGKYRSFTFRTWVTDGAISQLNISQSALSFVDQVRKGFDMTFGVPHSYDFRSTHKVKVESVEIKEDDVDEVDYQIYSYSLGLSYDKRDQRLNPREGYFYSLDFEKALDIDSEALDFTQIDLKLRHFIPTFEKQTIAVKTSFGYITASDIENEDLYVAQYYYTGGNRTVRGYRDRRPFAYGNKQVLLTAEYRFIFKPTFSLYLFADAGYAPWFRQDDDSYVYHEPTEFDKYRVGKGIGVYFVVPAVGPIRLDFGISDTGSSQLHFNLGHSF